MCSVGNVLGYPPDWQGQGNLKEGAEGSLGFLKAVLFCGSVKGVCIWGRGAVCQPLLYRGGGLVILSFPAPGRPVGGGCGFWNLINPSGMYAALASPMGRQGSGVQARACPDCGCAPWRGPPSGRLRLRPGLGWGWPRKLCRVAGIPAPCAKPLSSLLPGSTPAFHLPTHFSKVNPKGLLQPL